MWVLTCYNHAKRLTVKSLTDSSQCSNINENSCAFTIYIQYTHMGLENGKFLAVFVPLPKHRSPKNYNLCPPCPKSIPKYASY
jgi:hypothetical protein